MDLHKLHIFVAVAKAGHFTQAAEALHMSQPSVSQQMAQLEASLGAQLIHRQPLKAGRLQLTAAGEALLPRAEHLLALAEEATDATRVAAGRSDRTLRLGVGHILATYLLPDVWRRFKAEFPHHRIEITIGNTGELVQAIVQESVELGLLGLPANYPGVVARPFLHDRLLVIVPPDDPWVGRDGIEVEELQTRTLLVREPASALHSITERLLGPVILHSEGTIVLGETEAIKRSVEAGLGIALLPEIAVSREVAAGSLHAIPVQSPDARRIYAYVRLARHQLSRAAADLVSMLPGTGT
jgi:DNA-binding transcriptional LysR family regulator